MNDKSNRLGELLRERADRLFLLRSPRMGVAAEDYVRWRQGWRKPWYRIDTNAENGYPPKWMTRR